MAYNDAHYLISAQDDDDLIPSQISYTTFFLFPQTQTFSIVSALYMSSLDLQGSYLFLLKKILAQM